MKRLLFLPLMLLLLLLAACDQQTAGQPASTPTATQAITPTPAVTPTATVPEVPSHLVNFSTADHIQLTGRLYGQGKVAVICSHEFRTSKLIWDATGMPQRLASLGYAVLAYDFRGYGESQGDRDPTKMDTDVHAAITFMRQQGASKVILMGSSMGGTATLKAAASEKVAGVIALSSPQEFGITVSDADVKAIHAPKLFVASKDDTDFANAITHMYTVAAEPKELHIYEGSLHGTDMFNSDDGTDLIPRVLSFIKQNAPLA